MGGSDKWDTKWRDIGVPLITCTTYGIVHGWSWLLLPTFGLMFGSLTTYWDWLFKDDNFWFSGLIVGLSTLLLSWQLALIKAGVLCLAWGLWHLYHPSKVWKWDGAQVEEFGRGYMTVVVWLS